ncbi:MAG: carboxypeptidase regulatory-like domain-containing protein [Candidatus Omnitrophica bacterium]|nr:carboxypeptidase regulatory-like domain-containing protein [Candidatus Omnitrophota bacterium]
MTSRLRARVTLVVGLVVAIGCGGGKPQDASAKSNSDARPIQLAQAPEGGEAVQPTGSATVSGTVKFSGTAPSAERVKMDADPQCAMQHKEAVNKPEVVVNANGTLKHVFIYVKQGLEGKTFAAPTSSGSLNQHGCMYEPHVLGLQVGQRLDIVNSDSTLHNVNCKATKSKPFNLAQPTKGMKSSKQFTAPEIMVKCVCNVHPWMAAYVGVVAHPYFAVTGDEGSFSLAGLPAGTYTVAAWHEKYGEQTQDVTVADGAVSSVAFEFKAQ